MRTPRRQFLKAGSLATSGLVLAGPVPRLRAAVAAAAARYRAAVIGRTGGGDYGHGYDQIFNAVEGVTVEAVADVDPAGRARAAERAGARRQYADYRTMLREVKPDLVSIASRQPDCHREMALAAIEVCRGIFLEKPFTETVADANDILAAAEPRGVKIQVAHSRRYTRDFVKIQALIAEGFVGTVRTVRIQGKQDARAGGEDLMVLGTHDFDMLRFYFGDPQWCFASVTQNGREVTAADFKPGREPIRVAGDTIHALFGFPQNLVVHWSSVKTADHWNTNFSRAEKWAFEILGTKRVVAYQSGIEFAYLDSPFLLQKTNEVRWQALPEPERWEWPEHARHPIRSLIHAIENGGSPVCSGADGRWAIAMVAAIYESHQQKARVTLPLV